eukprot:TRINITY_DN102615_c0_g1_i1.p1 TRINITY_DN102615_c0_g1~~TRINITY_DN102615_c0_g1_i1.p1  ORF type:complete len:526 (+),score=110.21 TRINITY_DN102615_c0_g1_i1:56-1633(+)
MEPTTTVECDPRPASTDGSDGEESPMHSFIQQCLVDILNPLGEHIRELQEQMRRSHDDSMGQSVEQAKNQAVLKQQKDLTSALKQELDELRSAVTKSRTDMSKLIDIMSRASADRLQEFQLKFDQQIEASDAKLDQKLEELKNDFSMRFASLEASVDVLQASSKEHADAAKSLQDSSDYNNHCFLGLSERLETTRRHGEENGQDLQKLKLTVFSHHKEFVDGRTHATKRFDEIQRKLMALNEELHGSENSIDIRLGIFEEGLHAIGDKFATMEAELAASHQQDEQAEEGASAFERLSNRLNKIQDKLAALAHKLHDQAMGEVQNVTAIVDTHVVCIKHNAAKIDAIESNLKQLHDALSNATSTVSEHGQQLMLFGERADAAEANLKHLSNEQEVTASLLEKRSTELGEVTAAHSTTRQDVKTLQVDVDSLFSQMGITREEVENTAENLDLAHNYLHGVVTGLRDTHKLVFDERGSVLPHRKETAKKKQLPSLPRSPMPLSARRPQTSGTLGGSISRPMTAVVWNS